MLPLHHYNLSILSCNHHSEHSRKENSKTVNTTTTADVTKHYANIVPEYVTANVLHVTSTHQNVIHVARTTMNATTEIAGIFTQNDSKTVTVNKNSVFIVNSNCKMQNEIHSSQSFSNSTNKKHNIGHQYNTT
jgi:hypothetical protein